MKLKLFSLILAALFFHSCYTERITPALLTPESNNDDLFTILDLQFDDVSFTSAFMPSDKIVDFGFSEDQEVREVQYLRESRQSHQMKSLIRKYAHAALKGGDHKQGTIVFRVTYFDEKSNDFLRALSFFTFGVINLAGIPSGRKATTIELEADLYNANGQLIEQFRGLGSDSFYTGLFFYSPNQSRPSFIKCVKSALNEIDGKISTNKQELFHIMAYEPQ